MKNSNIEPKRHAFMLAVVFALIAQISVAAHYSFISMPREAAIGEAIEVSWSLNGSENACNLFLWQGPNNGWVKIDSNLNSTVQGYSLDTDGFQPFKYSRFKVTGSDDLSVTSNWYCSFWGYYSRASEPEQEPLSPTIQEGVSAPSLY